MSWVMEKEEKDSWSRPRIDLGTEESVVGFRG